ncbi:MAG TPA: glycosyltransferase family 2 protein [Roseiflexaceae bacterium]|nr:glycosyltransferase family 2 protein [Roseiflexaceae bacterium]HMP39498.1 glycosyltransferase family 2 protein [Roseiflexaceae bacterium]
MSSTFTEHVAPTPTRHAAELAISVVIPIHNEAESLPVIHQRLTEVFEAGPEPYRSSYEIILVDDGSTDESMQVCRELHTADPRVRVVAFRRNFGKTAALHAGFRLSRGRCIITIDADMQEDPADMFALLAKIDAGDDLVSAWRKQRNDPFSKTLPSRLFNFVVRRMTGVALHDFNCGFKAYRREVVDELDLYGEQHRFVPVLAHQRGFRVSEVAVEHKPRKYGRSKFGARRFGRGFLDFLQVLFLVTYMRWPLRLFGSIGTAMLAAGLLICLYLTGLWFLGAGPIGDRPLLILGVLLLLSGLQFFSVGLVSEMVRNSNYQAANDYSIRQILQQEETRD